MRHRFAFLESFKTYVVEQAGRCFSPAFIQSENGSIYLKYLKNEAATDGHYRIPFVNRNDFLCE